MVSRAASVSAQDRDQRFFGTLREQAGLQQRWLRKRVDTFLPALMRRYGIEDAIIGADGRIRWALRRQDRLFLVK